MIEVETAFLTEIMAVRSSFRIIVDGGYVRNTVLMAFCLLGLLEKTYLILNFSSTADILLSSTRQ